MKTDVTVEFMLTNANVHKASSMDKALKIIDIAQQIWLTRSLKIYGLEDTINNYSAES